tara:strand:+ start:511 stop:2238 length:1728 start_codon:yes stop_codon:yes gene_type:complete
VLSPEVNRLLLLFAIAITGYLIILQWDADYSQDSEVYVETPLVGATPERPETSIPISSDRYAASGDSDIPDNSLIVSSSPRPRLAEKTLSQDRFIQVRTPVMELWIDLLGGDIVRAELPGHPFELGATNRPYIILNQGDDLVYVAQSGLIGPDGVDASGRPLYTSAQQIYELVDGTLRVELETKVNDLRVKKVFEFASDDFLVEVKYAVTNESYSAIEASMFSQIKRDAREPIGAVSRFMGPRAYVGGMLTTNEDNYKKLSFEDLEEETYRIEHQGGWIAVLQHYFLSAWVGNPEERNLYFGQRRPDGTYAFGFTGPMQRVEPGETGEWSSRFYVGPKDQKRLEEIASNLNLTVDYGWLWWLAVPLWYILDMMHSLVGNWGIAIILLTVIVKLVTYPLSQKAYVSMANMRRVQPAMKRIQERFSDDRQKLGQEMMALYKKEKVNPMGGCLPMIIPMPIFLALYWVLLESVELRHAPFFLWIDDLSAKDPYFILPLIMGGSMYLQQLLSPAVGDPMQARMMKFMPVMFTVLFLWFPSGLVLYWLINNLLSLLQQWYVFKKHGLAGSPSGGDGGGSV